MDIIRISSIVADNLSPEDVDFIENADSTLFVELAEGDASNPLAIEKGQTWTLGSLVNDDYAHGCFVAFSSLDEDGDKIANALQDSSWIETKAFFGGDRYFAPAL